MEWVGDKEPSKSTTSVKEFTKVDGNARSYSMNGIKANAQIQVEQNVDIILKNLKLKILDQPLTKYYWQQTNSTSTTKQTWVA